MKSGILRMSLSILLVFVMAVFMMSVVANAEEADSVTIGNSVIVFEADALYTVGEGVEVLFGCAKGIETFNALAVDKTTGVLQFESADGEYEMLRDKEGNPITLSEADAKKVVAIYNDTMGTIRYFVNYALAYYGEGEALTIANDIPVSTAFVSAVGTESINVLTNALTYNINQSGTAEIVALQPHVSKNSVRFIAGVDTLWYTDIGYDIELFKDDTSLGVQSFETDCVFTGLIESGEKVSASTYGYQYFSVLAITDIDVSDGREYYVTIKPYTKIGETKYYGTTKKVDIGNNEYSFDESYNDSVSTQYTVNFVNYDGSLLKTEMVESGKGATAPSAPSRDGYIFTGWDKEFDSVTGDLTVNAIYIQITEPTIVIGNVIGRAGDEVTVTFDLYNSPELYAMMLKVAFDDTALTMISTASGEAMEAFTYTAPKSLRNGSNFVWYINDPAVANGTVLELTFRINDAAETGDYAITMTCDSNNTYDADDNDVNLDFVNGNITVAQ